ncbi:MAG: site-2 protease family protein [Clostridiaceae bacterium]|nr:site-2 protease family protein [Clostridiaceae bacterium]
MLVDNLKNPIIIVYLFLVFSFSISFHEMSHALSAYLLGDSTAKDKGRLTLDPLKHLDPFGTIMILFFSFGWAKPVPVNISNLKYKKLGMVLVSLAGPVSNMLLAFLFMIPLTYYGFRYDFDPKLMINRLGLFESTDINTVIINLCVLGVSMNTVLAVFNFIPFPPLDGSKIFSGLLPARIYFKLMNYHQIFYAILIILMITGAFGFILWPAVHFMVGVLDFAVKPLVAPFV